MENDSHRASSRGNASGASLVERAAREIERRTTHEPVDPPAEGVANGRPHQNAPQTAAPQSHKAWQSSVVAIDRAKLRAFGGLTPEDLRSQLAEEMRLIKRSLIRRMQQREGSYGNLVQITSAWPGEGKSFLALNLALSLASEMDYNVMLIDADVHRPVIMEALGIDGESGLLDVLRDPEMDVGDVIVRTDMSRLSVIGPGKGDQLSTERLSSHRMAAVTKELAERYRDRIIIFDTSPLLATSEPSVIAQLMGQVIIVVEADRTTREAIDQALELLPDDCQAGMVLNKSKGIVGGSALPYYGYQGAS